MDNFLISIESTFKDKIFKKVEYAGEVTLHTKREFVHEVLKSLKEQFGFNYLTDIVSVDNYTDDARFDISYNIYNLETKKRIRVKCFLEEDDARIISVCDIWPSANWYEREVYDMMGIKFDNHPDLRRIYMPEDFEYFPLRKEFPLIGIPGSIQMPEKDPPKTYK